MSEAFTEPFKIFGKIVAKLFSSILEPIKTAFDNGDWASLGLNIVLGIIEGILGGIATFVGSIVTFFKAVWDALCEVFGIHSPASTMVPIGLNIVLGILQGLTEGFVNVLSWVAEAGAQLISDVGKWCVDMWNAIGQWFTPIAQEIG